MTWADFVNLFIASSPEALDDIPLFGGRRAAIIRRSLRDKESPRQNHS